MAERAHFGALCWLLTFLSVSCVAGDVALRELCARISNKGSLIVAPIRRLSLSANTLSTEGLQHTNAHRSTVTHKCFTTRVLARVRTRYSLTHTVIAA